MQIDVNTIYWSNKESAQKDNTVKLDCKTDFQITVMCMYSCFCWCFKMCWCTSFWKQFLALVCECLVPVLALKTCHQDIHRVSHTTFVQCLAERTINSSCNVSWLLNLYSLSWLFLCSVVLRTPQPGYEASFCAAHSTSCRAITAIRVAMVLISHTECSTQSDRPETVLGKMIQMWWILFCCFYNLIFIAFVTNYAFSV